jgi:hypothetical protein
MKPEENTVYCRMLGHAVPLRYCLEPGNPDFCKNIISCWSDKFDIESYLNTHYSQEYISKTLNPEPRGKMASLVSLIQEAQRRTQDR